MYKRAALHALLQVAASRKGTTLNIRMAQNRVKNGITRAISSDGAVSYAPCLRPYPKIVNPLLKRQAIEEVGAEKYATIILIFLHTNI